ncbi:MAG: hypothetical protein H0U71_08340 [Gammaproteobacteria bacterium]|nr:hypothetical protein [Gammaproteobacteria bacterium]
MRCYLFIRYTVKDYSYWRAEYDGECIRGWRESNGEKSCQVFRDEDNPHQVTLLCEWKNADSAKKFISDPQLSDNMQISGVTDQPTIYLLHKD